MGVLGVATTSLGPVLVDSKGLTVYLLTADTRGIRPARHSACSTGLRCPPCRGRRSVQTSGVMATMAATKATGGASMVTAGGWPLYTFVKDKAPGDVAARARRPLVAPGLPGGAFRHAV